MRRLPSISEPSTATHYPSKPLWLHSNDFLSVLIRYGLREEVKESAAESAVRYTVSISASLSLMTEHRYTKSI